MCTYIGLVIVFHIYRLQILNNYNNDWTVDISKSAYRRNL